MIKDLFVLEVCERSAITKVPCSTTTCDVSVATGDLTERH